MNFYASPDYLSAVAEAYFPGRSASIEQVRVGDAVLRLLVIDDREVITAVPFLDYHEPLSTAGIGEVTRTYSHAQAVVRSVMELAAWEKDRSAGVDVAPFIDWSQFPTYEDYKSRIKKQSLVKEVPAARAQAF